MSFLISGLSAFEDKDFYQSRLPQVVARATDQDLPTAFSPDLFKKNGLFKGNIVNLYSTANRYQEGHATTDTQVIDRALIVTGAISDQQRLENKEFWKGKETSCKIGSIFAKVAAVVAAIAGAVLVLGGFSAPVGVALIASSFVLFGLGKLADHRQKQAAEQVFQWNLTPGEQVARARASETEAFLPESFLL
jgi:hypothetical protein